MTDLAADLEAAEQGSRELSDRVLLALKWHSRWNGRVWGTPNQDQWTHRPPHPTESVDDGLALLRELPEWSAGSLTWPGRRNGLLISAARATLRHELSSGGAPAVHGFAATLALALAAALVRAADQQKGGGAT